MSFYYHFDEKKNRHQSWPNSELMFFRGLFSFCLVYKNLAIMSSVDFLASSRSPTLQKSLFYPHLSARDSNPLLLPASIIIFYPSDLIPKESIHSRDFLTTSATVFIYNVSTSHKNCPLCQTAVHHL